MRPFTEMNKQTTKNKVKFRDSRTCRANTAGQKIKAGVQNRKKKKKNREK